MQETNSDDKKIRGETGFRNVTCSILYVFSSVETFSWDERRFRLGLRGKVDEYKLSQLQSR